MTQISKFFLSLILLEALSLTVFFYPTLETTAFVLICLAVFILSVWDLRYGVLSALAELFTGGMGYLFVLRADGLNLSIRMGLFLVLLAAFIYHAVRARRIEFFKSKLFPTYLFLTLFLFLGLFLGYFYGNNPAAIFFDGNGFFFLAYVFVFYQAFKKTDDLKIIWPVFWAAVLWLAIKTLLVFFIFTHGFVGIIPGLYKWIRDTGVGEITPAPGGFYRVFFQSQIFLVFAFIILVVKKILSVGSSQSIKKFFNMADSRQPTAESWLMPVFAAILLSFSRSFWLGLALASTAAFLAAVSFLRVPLLKAGKAAAAMTATVLGGLLLVYIVGYFPYPSRAAFSFSDVLGSRISASDAAAATRWAELKPLWRGITRHWVFGSGFGTAVTFKTQDPRILKISPAGDYTTYAFEWGWLDIILKIGFFGLLVYFNLLYKIFKRGLANFQFPISNFQSISNFQISNIGLLASLLALITIHIFTPYLNHPLGLGWLILTGLIIEKSELS